MTPAQAQNGAQINFATATANWGTIVAFGDSIKGGLRVWRRNPDRVTASLALVLVGVLAGLFATGLLEPLLDEYRLATLFGVSLGLLRACVTSMNERPRLPKGVLEISASRFATGGRR